MANPYDQFDAAPSAPPPVAQAGNPYDQFDSPEAAPPEDPRNKTGLQHLADTAGVFARHPFSAGVGMAENAISGIGAGVGSLAEAVTGADPGKYSQRLAYSPRTQAGQEISRLGSDEAAKIGQVYDRVAGTGPLAQTLKERLPQAVGAVGTVTSIAGLRGIGGFRLPANAGTRPPSVLRNNVPGEVPPAAAAGAETAAPPGRTARLAKLSEEAPTKEALRDAATAAYKVADDAGVVVSPESFGKLKKKIADEMSGEGIDPTLHPDASAALKRITEKEGELRLKDVETLRRIASDAEGSIKPADQRLAGKIVDEIDEYIDALGEVDVVAGDATKGRALKIARGLYSRAKKAEELDKLVERAKLTASNFTGSGMENALRTEFRALAKNERRMRRFTKEEQEAIRKVATGGKAENALRMLGRFAPTGPVSGVLSAAGGMMVAGPAGVALPLAGALARVGATKMTMRNAARANELVRRGPNALATAAPRNALRTEPVQ
jgi:hypothetical protein